MTDRVRMNFELEPERYEISEKKPYQFEMDRRDFFRVAGGGLVIFSLIEGASGQESGGGRQGPNAAPSDLGAWIHIKSDGLVHVYTGKAEVGQNARTSLTQVVAEELRAPASLIRITMADTDLTPFDMGTFGSRTTPIMVPILRRAAAAAREALVELAAKRWGVDASDVEVSAGRVVHRTSRETLAFSQLTEGQKIMRTIAADAKLTPTEQWTSAGRSLLKVNGRDVVTGRHRYTADQRLEGMLYGKIVRPPSFGSSLVSANTATARAMPGVTVVHDGNFLGTTAASEHRADEAALAIRAEWKPSPQVSEKELYAHLKANPQGTSRPDVRGTVATGMSQAAIKLNQTYTVAYIAHTPLEPRAAVAEWKDDRLTVWTGTQRPFGVKSELAEAFRIPESRIRVIVPDTGSGYGGKHTGETAIEAARLAKAAGKPVKLTWTREEEFTWAYFRPAGVIEIASGVQTDGRLTAWEFHNYNSGAAGIPTPYDIANQHIEFHPTSYPLRQGSYRGLAATANHFARESHMDELAHALKMDPLKFRYRNLKDSRLRAVFEAGAERFRWGRKKDSDDRGLGFAGGYEKGGYVSTFVELRVDRPSGKVRIDRVVAAFECGAVINPEHLKNQIEGSMVQGIGGALFEEIHFENGKILNPKLSQYRVPRFSDLPSIEVVLIDRKDLPPAGAGETPIVGLAPAVANAIYDATSVRLRGLPMVPHGLKLNG